MIFSRFVIPLIFIISASLACPVAAAVKITDIYQNTAVHQISDPDPNPDINWGMSPVLLGDTLFIGAPASQGSEQTGRIELYVYNENSWGLQQTFTSPGHPGDGFGHSIAVADTILAIGAPYGKNDDGEATGKVYLYILENLEWNLRHTLAPEFLYDESLFGFSVDVDSGRVIAGAPGRHFIDEVQEDTTRSVGAAYGFDLTWNYDGETLNHNNMNISLPRRDERFGYDVSIKGRQAVIGTNPAGLSAITAPFRAALFEQPRIANPGWRSVEILTRDDHQTGDHGESVAATRHTAFVGAPSKLVEDPDTGESSSMGSVFAYFFDPEDYRIHGEQELVPSHPRSFLNYSAGLAADDRILAVSGVDIIDIYAYESNSGSWERSEIIVADTAGEMRFGTHVDFNDRFIVTTGTTGSGEDRQSKVFWARHKTATSSDHPGYPLESARKAILHGAYPNPFNTNTNITFTLEQQYNTRLEIYSVTGEKIVVLTDGIMPAGYHTIRWDASDHASGVYLIRLQAGDHQSTGRITLIK